MLNAAVCRGWRLQDCGIRKQEMNTRGHSGENNKGYFNPILRTSGRNRRLKQRISRDELRLRKIKEQA